MPPPEYPISVSVQNVFVDVTMTLPRKNFFVSGKTMTRQILHGVSVFVNPGEVLAIMGPTGIEQIYNRDLTQEGCGKTTLLNVIGGRITKGVSGSVLFNGKPRTKQMKRKLGYIEQNDILFGSLTVEEVVTWTM